MENWAQKFCSQQGGREAEKGGAGEDDKPFQATPQRLPPTSPAPPTGPAPNCKCNGEFINAGSTGEEAIPMKQSLSKSLSSYTGVWVCALGGSFHLNHNRHPVFPEMCETSTVTCLLFTAEFFLVLRLNLYSRLFTLIDTPSTLFLRERLSC